MRGGQGSGKIPLTHAELRLCVCVCVRVRQRVCARGQAGKSGRPWVTESGTWTCNLTLQRFRLEAMSTQVLVEARE